MTELTKIFKMKLIKNNRIILQMAKMLRADKVTRESLKLYNRRLLGVRTVIISRVGTF